MCQSMHLIEHRLQAHLANGTSSTGYIKPEYYCEEYKDAIDVHNAALIIELWEARAIKCEELRQKALR